MTRGMIWAYETGRQVPSLETLMRLSSALQIEPENFFKQVKILEPESGRPPHSGNGARRQEVGQGALPADAGKPLLPSEDPQRAIARDELDEVLGNLIVEIGRLRQILRHL